MDISFFLCCAYPTYQSYPTLFDPMDCSPPGSSVHGDSPGKNTGVGCHALLHGLFPTQGLTPGLPHYRQVLYCLSYQGSPRTPEWVAYPSSRGSSWPRKSYLGLLHCRQILYQLRYQGSPFIYASYYIKLKSKIYTLNNTLRQWSTVHILPLSWIKNGISSFIINEDKYLFAFSSVLSRVQLFATPWISACQACVSKTPGDYSNSCPSSWWCHPAISSSVMLFSSCPQSLPASGSFPVSQLFAWGGQSTGVSASASVLPMNTQDWSPLGWTG